MVEDAEGVAGPGFSYVEGVFSPPPGGRANGSMTKRILIDADERPERELTVYRYDGNTGRGRTKAGAW
jgi:hypothetical protein